MSNSKGGRPGFRNFKQNKHNSNKIESAGIDKTKPIISQFREYSKELDDKHDRYERIIKLSRDITIESKRIIFLLHTVDLKKNNTENVLKEAETRLNSLCDVNFKLIAKELSGLDQYQYSRAYSPGLQEFIEAYTFYEYLCNKKTCDWKSLQKKLDYEVVKDNEKDEETCDNSENTKIIKEIKSKNFCLVQPVEFILGLADVGGEIMRRCINSLGSGHIQTCFESCRSLQELYAGYLAVNTSRCRYLSRKIYTLKQSVVKVENVCYNVKVRGGEAAKWGTITDAFSEKHFDEDEGFF